MLLIRDNDFLSLPHPIHLPIVSKIYHKIQQFQFSIHPLIVLCLGYYLEIFSLAPIHPWIGACYDVSPPRSSLLSWVEPILALPPHNKQQGKLFHKLSSRDVRQIQYLDTTTQDAILAGAAGSSNRPSPPTRGTVVVA